MSNILVYAEIADNQVHDASLQGLAKARDVASPGQKIVALAAGSGVTAAAQTLFGYGADEVVVADAPALKEYLMAAYLNVVQALLAQQPCSLLIFPASTCGNDLAPAVAAALGAACVLDAVDLKAAAGKLAARRIEFDRKVFTDYAAVGDRPLVITAKDGIAPAPSPDASRQGAVKPLAVAVGSEGSKVIRRDVARKSVNLKAARIIVAAGAGIGSRDNFAKVQELAAALGAQIGATRAVVDAGWLPADHQIGQTGATVRPDLYIGCGVSGAVQHWVGMSDAKKIVAINTDKSAPIMKHAHYRITADVNAVLPKLIKLLK
jgi:electron transfer flavoprotein alpha subunit